MGQNDRIPLPDPHGAARGWAAPTTNFPGKGSAVPFRYRPRGAFDLSAKVHDMNYHVNGVDITARFDTPTLLVTGAAAVLPLVSGFLSSYTSLEQRVTTAHRAALAREWPDLPTEERNLISRMAKSDYIFRRMNECKNAEVRRSLLHAGYNWTSQLIFLDRESDRMFWQARDGFRNVLRDAGYWAALCNADRYLMIPFNALSDHRSNYTVRQRCHAGKYVQHCVSERLPSYNRLHPMDLDPGFAGWFPRAYASVLTDIRAI